MSVSSIYISWFDLVVLILLVVGVRCGQKRGMSEEMLLLLQWLCIVLIAGLGYEPLGMLLNQLGMFSLVFCYLSAYVLLAIVVKLIFSAIRRSVGDKLLESDVFGRAEYALGMAAGAVRYFCVVLVVMSLLHARHFSRAEREAHRTYQNVNYGTVLFPSISDIQDEVFQRSYTGQFSEDYLGLMFIRQTAGERVPLKPSGVVKAREREMQQVLEKP